MKKSVKCLVFLFVFLIGTAMGAENNGSNEVKDFSEDFGEKELNIKFYFALGVLGVGLLILLYIFYSILKRPKNRWE